MGKENNNRFYEDFDRVNRELNQITNGPKKEQKAIDPKRKIFDGEHDPDPSDVFDKWEREKKLNSVVASYPTSESNVEFLKAKREILNKLPIDTIDKANLKLSKQIVHGDFYLDNSTYVLTISYNLL